MASKRVTESQVGPSTSKVSKDSQGSLPKAVMASKKVVESEAGPSTSKVSKDSPGSLGRLGDLFSAVVQTELDIDELIRALNDEYKKVKERPLIPNELTLQAKSNAWSAELRLIGDRHHKEGDFETAIAFYTRSILYAEDGSEELALAYLRRSASLQKVPYYDQCLEDINRALVGKCPPAMKQKLEKRKYRCFIERRKANAKNQTSPALLLGKMRPESTTVGGSNVDDVEAEFSDKCKFENPRIPGASSKIRIGYDEEKWGQYIEAVEDLEAGEIVGSQKLFAAFVVEEMLCECCSYCLKVCPAMIPCPTCTKMLYCSEDCRNVAFDLYHRLECKILTQFFSLKHIPTDHKDFYPVRELLIGTEQGAQLGNLMQRMTIQDIMATDFPASDTFVADYATTMRLSSSYFRNKVKESVPYAAEMIAILEYVGFFDGDPSFRADPKHQDTLTEAQIFTAFLLLNHQVGMNFHMICIKVYLDDEDGIRDYKVGSCYCALYSIFNHSCDPNVSFLVRNREVVAFTERPIAKGEELLVAYGITFMAQERKVRIENLRTSHGFICQCVACIHEWPTKDEIIKYPLEFHNHIKQKRARKELKRLLSLIADESKFNSSTVKEMLPTALDVCTWLYTNMKYPSYEHGFIQSLVTMLMIVRYDQFCQYCPIESARRYTFSVLNGIAYRTATDVTPATPETARENKTQEPLLCTKFLK